MQDANDKKDAFQPAPSKSPRPDAGDTEPAHRLGQLTWWSMTPKSSRFTTIQQAHRRFEALCIKVLTETGYSNDTDIENYRNPDAADFVGRDPEGKQTVAEFALTLSNRMQLSWMEQAIARTLRRS